MARLLILYSTTDGHTLKICQRMSQTIEQTGHDCELVAIDEAGTLDLEAFDKIVIGASIRYGKHSHAVTEFIDSHQRLLEGRPNAFFSVNLVARKPGKNQPENNPYLKKFLKRIDWKPRLLRVFAGKLDYPRYGFVDRTVIRLIMWMTGGPTDPAAVVEYTDWEQVDDFARLIGET